MKLLKELKELKELKRHLPTSDCPSRELYQLLRKQGAHIAPNTPEGKRNPYKGIQHKAEWKIS
jgi:hypothetical protein